MKLFNSFLAILIVVIGFSSCQKEPIVTKPIAGTYKVSSLIISETDKTQDMTPYTITFDDNGMMTINDSAGSYSCEWSDNCGMMNDMHEYHFDMGGCPDDSPMKLLDHDWVMDSQNDQACSFHQKDDNSNTLSLQKI
jgi:hypothetical protein